MPRRPMESAPVAPAEQAVAAYVRVSTDEQKRSGLGLEAQRARVMAMALVKDWPEPTIYSDEGISGTKESAKRPGLARMLAECRAGQYRAVIILSLDRLGRKTRLVLDLVEELTRGGVALVSCKEQLDTGTPQGQFVLTMFAALAQLERDLIAERTKAALAAKRERDGVAGGKLPHGYHRLPDGRIGVDRAAARVVRLAFEWHVAGWSLRVIARALQEAGYPTPRAGETWRHTAIATMLANEAVYRGERKLPVILDAA